MEGKPEGGVIAKQGCEEGEVVEEAEAEEDEEREEEVEEEEEEEEVVECPEGEYSAEGSTSPQEAVAGASTTGPTKERMGKRGHIAPSHHRHHHHCSAPPPSPTLFVALS